MYIHIYFNIRAINSTIMEVLIFSQYKYQILFNNIHFKYLYYAATITELQYFEMLIS